ncbi:MAG: hypothetical protein R3183_03450 [Oleiphilaceae bacterium]|nr:hypothetical protein [Oleiphilaceae bacterium]
MKKLFPVFMVSAGLALGSTYAYASSGQKNDVEGIKHESQELLQAIENYSEKQKTKALELVDENLDRLDARIETLEQRLSKEWSELSEQARAEISGQLMALRKERIEVAEWYGSLKQDSGEAWNELKAGFAESYEALSQAWQEAEASFDEQS